MEIDCSDPGLPRLRSRFARLRHRSSADKFRDVTWDLDWDRRIAAAAEELRDEIVDFTTRMIRIPTVNPPGEHYDDCARLIGEQYTRLGFETTYHPADGRPEHSEAHPRLNVLGKARGSAQRPRIHLNGHLDVVPAGDGWQRAPFGGEVHNGRIFGRGAADMKSGIAAALYACEALRRSGLRTLGSLELSATVDEESGGFAGVAWLAERGILDSDRVDHVIIPEPFGPARVCTGHRGVYWLRIRSVGRTAHGSMPHLGVNAIEQLGPLLEALRTRLQPRLAQRITTVPVVPDGVSQRHPEHQLHRGRTGRHGSPDSLRRRELRGRARSPLPGRGGLRGSPAGDRRTRSRDRERRDPTGATRSTT